MWYIYHMQAKKKLKKDITISVRIDTATVEMVQSNKKETGVPVGKFFELAAKDKLKKK